MKIDIDDLTIGDLVLFEEVAGQTIAEIGKAPSAKAIRALVLIELRRSDPAATVEQVDALKLDDIDITGGDELDPTDGDDEPSSS